MTATIWSKFFWSDWQADPALRACSLAARGLWMEMLCIAAGERGYLVRDGDPLPAQTLANIVGQPLATVETLIAELDENRVFSRDRRGRIYSRRMVRDAKLRAAAQKAGKRGGNPTLCKTSEKPQTLNGADKALLGPISHKPESKSHAPESSNGAALMASPIASLIRAAEAMGTTFDALQRKHGWSLFGETLASWLQEGCDPERDIWPTLRRLASKRGNVPASPAYFADAVREARDRRGESPRLPIYAPAASPGAFITAEQWAERARMFHEQGAWSRRWGPKPGEPGCVATAAARAEAV